MLKGFRDFILRGNVVDLAVAVMIGAAFNAIVTSLVKDILTQLIAALVGKPDFSGVVVASVVYFGVVLPLNTLLNKLKKRAPAPTPAPPTKTCPECLSEIPLAATRCAHCTQPVA